MTVNEYVARTSKMIGVPCEIAPGSSITQTVTAVRAIGGDRVAVTFRNDSDGSFGTAVIGGLS